MKFRYFDAAGQQLTREQLNSIKVLTPAMDHVFATVADRVEKGGNLENRIENSPSE